jgi:hypothetical protein
VSSDIVWETFDSLFKTLHHQGRLIEQLTERLAKTEEQYRLLQGQLEALRTFVAGPPAAVVRADPPERGYEVVKQGERVSFLYCEQPYDAEELQQITDSLRHQMDDETVELRWREPEEVTVDG